MNYEEMSNYEINKEVSKHCNEISNHLGFEKTEVKFNDKNEAVYIIAKKDGLFDGLPVAHFDPCNNPNDAWPIIVDNKISTSPTGDSWICGSSVFGTQTIDKNPLRAAMICFLKMKDTEVKNNQ